MSMSPCMLPGILGKTYPRLRRIILICFTVSFLFRLLLILFFLDRGGLPGGGFRRFCIATDKSPPRTRGCGFLELGFSSAGFLPGGVVSVFFTATDKSSPRTRGCGFLELGFYQPRS